MAFAEYRCAAANPPVSGGGEVQYRSLIADDAEMSIRIGKADLDARLTRAMNLLVALLALILLAPVLLMIAVAIRLGGAGPILFAHHRIGLNGISFPCFKFRSMVPDADERLMRLLASDPDARCEWETTHKLRRDPRITWIGQFLRRSSMDELPQLFNVLRGEMSIVGPRPIVATEVERFGRYFADYCSTLPGITGLWQIRLGLDVRIMLMTLPAVLIARGSC
jgi:exopolysaccharide production protein ExoY